MEYFAFAVYLLILASMTAITLKLRKGRPVFHTVLALIISLLWPVTFTLSLVLVAFFGIKLPGLEVDVEFEGDESERP